MAPYVDKMSTKPGENCIMITFTILTVH